MQLTIKQQKPLFRDNTLVYTSIAALLSYTLTGCGSSGYAAAPAEKSTEKNTQDLSGQTGPVTVSMEDMKNMQWHLTGTPGVTNDISDTT